MSDGRSGGSERKCFGCSARVKLFYGKAKDRADVAGDSPAEASLESALEIFRVLEPGKGFIGIALTERHVLQLLVGNAVVWCMAVAFLRW